MITRIRNGQKAGLLEIALFWPQPKFCFKVLALLQKEGYIRGLKKAILKNKECFTDDSCSISTKKLDDIIVEYDAEFYKYVHSIADQHFIENKIRPFCSKNIFVEFPFLEEHWLAFYLSIFPKIRYLLSSSFFASVHKEYSLSSSWKLIFLHCFIFDIFFIQSCNNFLLLEYLDYKFQIL